MSDLSKQLVQMAIEEANRFQMRKHDLNKQVRDLEERAAQLQASLSAADLAIKRLDSFEASIGDDPQCPRCWIARGAHVAMIPQPSGTELDKFSCRECHFEFEV